MWWLRQEDCCEFQVSQGSTPKVLKLVTYTSNPSAWETEAGGSQDPGHPYLYSEFEATLGLQKGPPSNNVKAKPKKKKKKKNQKKKPTNKKPHKQNFKMPGRYYLQSNDSVIMIP